MSSLKELMRLSALPRLSQLWIASNPFAESEEHVLKFCVYHMRGLESLDGTAIDPDTKRRSRISRSPLEIKQSESEPTGAARSADKRISERHCRLTETVREVCGVMSENGKKSANCREIKKRDKLRGLNKQADAMRDDLAGKQKELEAIKEDIRRKNDHLTMLRKQMSERSIESYISDADGFTIHEEKASSTELRELEKQCLRKEEECANLANEIEALVQTIAGLQSSLVLTEKPRKFSDLNLLESDPEVEAILEEKGNATCASFLPEEMPPSQVPVQAQPTLQLNSEASLPPALESSFKGSQEIFADLTNAAPEENEEDKTEPAEPEEEKRLSTIDIGTDTVQTLSEQMVTAEASVQVKEERELREETTRVTPAKDRMGEIAEAVDDVLGLFPESAEEKMAVAPETVPSVDQVKVRLVLLKQLVSPMVSAEPQLQEQIKISQTGNAMLRDQMETQQKELQSLADVNTSLRTQLAEANSRFEVERQNSAATQDLQQKLAEREATVAEQRERMEEQTTRHEQLKAKIEGYKEQIGSLQSMLEKLSESVASNTRRTRSMNLCRVQSEREDAAGKGDDNISELVTSMKKTLADREEELVLAKSDCEEKQKTIVELDKRCQDVINEAKALEAGSADTMRRVLQVNKYLESSLHKKGSGADMSAMLDNSTIVPEPQCEDAKVWTTVSRFVSNVKTYIKKARKYKHKLREMKDTKAQFMAYVEREVDELTKSWNLLEEKQKETKDMLAGIAKREAELTRKERAEGTEVQARRNAMTKEVDEMLKKRQVLAESVDALAAKEEALVRTVSKEQKNNGIIMENCQKEMEARSAEVEALQKEVAELKAGRTQLSEEVQGLRAEVSENERKLMVR